MEVKSGEAKAWEKVSGAEPATEKPTERNKTAGSNVSVAAKPAAKRKAAAKSRTPSSSKSPNGNSSSGKSSNGKPGPLRSAAKSSATVSVKAEPVSAPGSSDGADGAAPKAEPAASVPVPIASPSAMVSAPSMITQKDASGSSIVGIALGLVAIALVLTHPMWTPGLYTTTADPEGWLTADKVDARLSKEVAALEGSLAAVAERQGELSTSLEASRLPGMLLIANLLNDALWNADPFQRQLNLFVAVADGRDEVQGIIEGLQGYAGSGIPTEQNLISSFDGVVTAIITEDQRSGTSESLADQVRDTISSIAAMTTRLRWRLDGAPDGAGVIATTARAEALVAEGRFGEAIEALGSLPVTMQPLYADWVASVEARDRGLRARTELGDFIVQMAARMEPRG